MMTKEEMKAMQGFEFTYVFKTGNSVPAYVKKFDETTGKISCWSLSLITSEGTNIEPMNEDEYKEGACCVLVGLDIDHSRKLLKRIKKDGKYVVEDRGNFNFFNGCIF